MRRWAVLLALALMAAMAGQIAAGIVSNSATFDEANHIARGIAILVTNDWRLSVAHPPLANVMSGLAVMLSDVPLLPLESAAWRSAEIWDFAHRWLWIDAPDPQRLIVLGRLPILLLSLILALFAFLWASRLYGRPAAYLALALCAFEPNLLAHGGLATTDMAVTLFAALAMFQVWRLMSRPTLANLALAGITFGLMQVSKFSALVLVPAYALLLLIGPHVVTREGGAPRPRWPRALWTAIVRFAAIAAVAGVTIWAVYGFRVQPVLHHQPRHRLIERIIENPQQRERVVVILERTPLPARQYFVGLANAFSHQRGGHPAFLMGRSSERGWWHYFFVAIAIKTPIPLLILITWAVVISRRRRRGDEWFLIIPVAIILLSTVKWHINIGLRHILPIYPLLIIFASKVWATPDGQAALPRSRWWAVSLLLAWSVGEAVFIFPQHLAYFNEFMGGPARGQRYLVDSNLDWGQDLIRLRHEMERRNIDRVKLSYFGSALPERYGIEYEPLTGVSYSRQAALLPPEKWEQGCRPTDGWIAISATCLENIGGYLGSGLDFDWLKSYHPVGRAGHSILIYHIKPREDAACCPSDRRYQSPRSASLSAPLSR